MASHATRLPNGVNTSNINDTYGNYLIWDPTRTISYIEDFSMHSDIMLATPTSHTVTATGTFTRAFTSISGVEGGFGLFTTSTNISDGGNIQHKSESFFSDRGKRQVLKVSFKTTDVLDTDIFIGLANTVSDAIVANFKIGFLKLSNQTGVLNAVVANEGTGQEFPDPLVLENNTFYNLSIAYLPEQKKAQFLVNDVVFSELTNLTHYPFDTTLTPTITYFTTTAAAKSLTVDYLNAEFER